MREHFSGWQTTVLIAEIIVVHFYGQLFHSIHPSLCKATIRSAYLAGAKNIVKRIKAEIDLYAHYYCGRSITQTYNLSIHRCCITCSIAVHRICCIQTVLQSIQLIHNKFSIIRRHICIKHLLSIGNLAYQTFISCNRSISSTHCSLQCLTSSNSGISTTAICDQITSHSYRITQGRKRTNLHFDCI